MQYAVSITRVASPFSTVFRFTPKAIEQLDCSRKLCGMSGFRPTAKLVLYRYAKTAVSNCVLCSEAIQIIQAAIRERKTASYTIAHPKTWAQILTGPPDYYTVLTFIREIQRLTGDCMCALIQKVRINEVAIAS